MRVSRISIVTPSLNQAEYLEETLTSVLDQGFGGIEYVVIDGGSNDGSVDIIRRYADRLSYWVSEPDRGHADAINKGFVHTSGEIMAWINSSDVYLPWTLETVAQVFRDLPEVEWIEGMPAYVDTGRWPRGIGLGFCNRYDLLLGHEGTIQQESVFWRRSLWEKAGGKLGDSLRLACDYELWLRFSRHAPLYHVSTVLGAFRFHDDRRGLALRGDYAQEAIRVRDAELARLSAGERANVALLRCVRRGVGRRASTLLGRAKALPGHRYPRIVYDFLERKWRVV
jgi:glycosyltransferase involved in cell wall biosynthesis